MRELAAALMLLSLPGCVGSCDDRNPMPRADAAASTTAVTSAERLSHATLEGVFPPRWRVGDHWRVSVQDREMTFGTVRQVTKEYDYRVAAIPGDGGGEYRIEAGWRGKPHHVITFRVRDGSLASWSDYPNDKSRPISLDPRETSEAIPYMRYGAAPPVFAFPILPPDLQNPFGYLVPERHWNAGIQTIETTSEGLRFIIREADQLGNLAQVIEWRRGEPWWSTARFWSLGEAEEQPENGIFSREPSWSAELVRPEDPEPLPGWPWEPPK